jgi:hypothetical protein
VKGNTIDGGVIVSRFEGKVDFADLLNNRIINLVPMSNIADVVAFASDQTQTVPIYPEALREQLRDRLALAGCQRIVPLAPEPARERNAEELEAPGLPHDGIEPMRRMVRWVIDQSKLPEPVMAAEVPVEMAGAAQRAHAD